MSDPDTPANLPSPGEPTPRRVPASPSVARPTLPKPVAGRIVVPGVHPGDVHEAVTLPPEPRARARAAVRWSPVATLCLVLAVAVLIAVERIGAPSGFRTFRYGVALAVLMLVLAAIASFLPTALWREGSLLAWNALGLTIGVVMLGVLGVSSMLALPPVLVGIALTSWPRPAATPTPASDTPEVPRVNLDADTGQRVALVSGLLVIPLLALAEWLFLRGGQG